MKLSDQRLDEILAQLRAHTGGAPAVGVEEWLSIALELRQLRLRTSAQSRAATPPERAHGSS